MKDLLYFDIEYANTKNKSICQMGLMIENFKTKNPTYPELELLVNPNDDFQQECVNVHHITKEKVKNERTFDEIWPSIEKYFINSIVVGYNIASSDLDGLCKNLIRYNIPLPELWYIDVYEIVKDNICSPELKDLRLSSVCNYFDIDTGDEHNAFDDACACADLLAFLIDEFSITIDDYVRHYDFDRDYSFSPYFCSLVLTRELNILLGEIEGMLIDGKITDGEVKYLNEWREKNENFSSDKNGSLVLEKIDEILEDNIVTVEEATELKKLIIHISQSFNSSIETKATQELQGIINGINADGVVEETEIIELQKWLYHNQYLVGHYPYDKINDAICKVLEDKIVTKEESKYLVDLFDELFNPVKEIVSHAIIFDGKEFVLSGDFEHGSKKDIEEFIISKGGTINSGVRKKTDYVVVGGYGSGAYSNGNYGTKVKKALELGIIVLTEKQLYGEI